MSTRTSEEIKHEGLFPVEESTYKSEGALQVGQQPIEEHQMRRRCQPIPEQEILRRLWRIYQMALTTADRTIETDQSISQ